jgi:CRP-like cAMP-binding protein
MSSQTLHRDRQYTAFSPEERSVLARLPLFAGLSEDAVAALLSGARIKAVPRNGTIFMQGDRAANFFVVFDGWVKLFRITEDGEESVIGVFARGESFAEAAIFDNQDYPVNAVAAVDSRLLTIPAESFLGELQSNPSYALNIMASMSRHLRQLVQQIEQLSVRSAAERLAGFLVRLSSQSEGPAVVILPLEKSLIAGRLGMQPETFSRALAKLAKRGVRCSGNVVEIDDLVGLKRYSVGAGR